MQTDLTCRRQFALDPEGITAPEFWTRVPLQGVGTLQVHPDLPLSTVSGPRFVLTLLGDVYDPYRPELGNTEILQRIATRAASESDLVAEYSMLGGRWICFATGPDEALLLRDACGLREVFYDGGAAPETWCASQAFPIARARGYARDRVTADEFEHSTYRAANDGYWWPGDSTPYRELKCLLPNHVLDLRSCTPRRCWPLAPIAPRDVDDAADEAARVLSGLTRAGAARYPLAMPLTAGLDSRTLLAAARAQAEDLYVFTFRRPGMERSHPDLRVPRRLAKQAGLKHHVIPAAVALDPEFRRLYHASADPVAEEACAILAGLREAYPAERLWVSSHGSEISRGGMHVETGRPSRLDGEGLAWVYQMSGNRFAAEHLQRWLDAARPYAESSGIDVLDLSYWEQRIGRWAAHGLTQWDILVDRLPPFSSQHLLETLLGVDEKHRDRPWSLHLKIVERLWPELLDVPLNPTPGRRGIAGMGRRSRRMVRRALSQVRRANGGGT